MLGIGWSLVSEWEGEGNIVSKGKGWVFGVLLMRVINYELLLDEQQVAGIYFATAFRTRSIYRSIQYMYMWEFLDLHMYLSNLVGKTANESLHDDSTTLFRRPA